MTDSPAPPRRKIFISYRHGDNQDFVERIRDWFAWKFGRDNVFIDFDSIGLVKPWRDVILEQIPQCDLLIVIIGPRWLEIMQDRIRNGDEDVVQLEISLALQSNKPVVPICIKNTSVPTAKDLPQQIRSILQYNADTLNSGRHFLDNIERILKEIEQQLVLRDLEKPEFDVLLAIRDYQNAAERRDWQGALNLLSQIRKSGYVPDVYPLDEYEQEALEAISRQSAEAKYSIIRLMAQRALKQPQDKPKIWSALKKLWLDYPSYDPDDLAAQFRLQPESQTIEVERIPSSETFYTPTVAHSHLVAFDPSIFDHLESFDDSAADDLLDPDKLAVIAEKLGTAENTIPLEEAEKSGILDWQE